MRRLLVPLDDQPVSEETLRLIAEAARGAASTVRLLYVPPIRPHGDGAEKRRLQAEGLDYLDMIAESLGDVPVERVIRFGDVNMAILDEAAAWAADVVALSAGDRMWLSRAVRTGTAAEAFGRNGIPAILYTPGRRPKHVSRRNRRRGAMTGPTTWAMRRDQGLARSSRS